MILKDIEKFIPKSYSYSISDTRKVKHSNRYKEVKNETGIGNIIDHDFNKNHRYSIRISNNNKSIIDISINELRELYRKSYSCESKEFDLIISKICNWQNIIIENGKIKDFVISFDYIIDGKIVNDEWAYVYDNFCFLEVK